MSFVFCSLEGGVVEVFGEKCFSQITHTFTLLPPSPASAIFCMRSVLEPNTCDTISDKGEQRPDQPSTQDHGTIWDLTITSARNPCTACPCGAQLPFACPPQMRWASSTLLLCSYHARPASLVPWIEPVATNTCPGFVPRSGFFCEASATAIASRCRQTGDTPTERQTRCSPSRPELLLRAS